MKQDYNVLFIINFRIIEIQLRNKQEQWDPSEKQNYHRPEYGYNWRKQNIIIRSRKHTYVTRNTAGNTRVEQTIQNAQWQQHHQLWTQPYRSYHLGFGFPILEEKAVWNSWKDIRRELVDVWVESGYSEAEFEYQEQKYQYSEADEQNQYRT